MGIITSILGATIGLVLYGLIMELMTYINSKKQHVFVYCPKCDTELVKHGEILEDNDGIITYKCVKCGNESKWDIAHYPAPIWIDDEDIFDY